MDAKAIGAQVRSARLRAGLSQDELGRRILAGKSAVQKIERGDHDMGATRLAAIARVLGCSADELLGLSALDVSLAEPERRYDPGQSPLELWFERLPARLQRALLGAALAYEDPEISSPLFEQLLGHLPRRRARRTGRAGRVKASGGKGRG